MRESLLQIWNRLVQQWKQFSRSQKIQISIIVVAAIVTILILSITLSRTQYSTAFTNLQPNDAASIKDYLQKSNIPFKLSPDGTSIGVPTKDVASVRLDVESQGLNKSGSIGYGAFNNSNSLGMTDNVFNVKFLSAVQGEIEQMFNLIQGVESSKVMINLPKNNVFLSDVPQVSSAAVVLTIKPGFQFSQKQIDTMYDLVAKSIPKLSYDNITISDQNGDLLAYSQSGGLDTSSQIAEQMSVKRQYEADIQKKVLQILGPIVGIQNVVPVATATLNFDKKNQKSQLVQPVVNNQGLPVSQQQVQKSSSSSGGQASGGVAGTGSTQVPGYPGSTGSGQSSSDETDTTTNYDVNHISESIVYSPYAVKDLTISVGISPPGKSTAIPQATLTSIDKILTNIVSASLADNGQTYTSQQLQSKVNVVVMPFRASQQTSSGTGIKNKYVYWAAGAAALLLIGALGLVAVRRRRTQQADEMEDAPIQTKRPVPTIDFENVNDHEVRNQLEALAKRKPEDFVNLLRTWLVDE